MPALFSPIRFGSLELANRIVIPPMCMYSAEEGCATSWHQMHYGNLAQSGIMFTGEKLKPDWSKVNPLKGFKRIFGPDGLVQFIKTFLKLLAVVVVCWLVLKPHANELANMAAMSSALSCKPSTWLTRATRTLTGARAGSWPRPRSPGRPGRRRCPESARWRAPWLRLAG